MKTLVQCDFDGTITEEDVGFLLLDKFGQGDWQQLLREYQAHSITVDTFNTRVFAMVKADKATLLEAVDKMARVREGFHELVDYCSGKDIRLVIVSNGLAFYIEAILKRIGLENISIHAAQTEFHPEGLKVKYIGPDGRRLGRQSDDGLKETYTRLFLKEGYRVVYVGNGDSDIHAARYAHHVFARDTLLECCRENGINCMPFADLNDVVEGLENLDR